MDEGQSFFSLTSENYSETFRKGSDLRQGKNKIKEAKNNNVHTTGKCMKQ